MCLCVCVSHNHCCTYPMLGLLMPLTGIDNSAALKKRIEGITSEPDTAAAAWVVGNPAGAQDTPAAANVSMHTCARAMTLRRRCSAENCRCAPQPCTHTLIQKLMHPYTNSCTHTQTRARIHKRMLSDTNACTHTQTHVLTRILMHTPCGTGLSSHAAPRSSRV